MPGAVRNRPGMPHPHRTPPATRRRDRTAYTDTTRYAGKSPGRSCRGFDKPFDLGSLKTLFAFKQHEVLTPHLEAGVTDLFERETIRPAGPLFCSRSARPLVGIVQATTRRPLTKRQYPFTFVNELGRAFALETNSFSGFLFPTRRRWRVWPGIDPGSGESPWVRGWGAKGVMRVRDARAWCRGGLA